MSSAAFAYLAVGLNHDPIWAAGNTLTGIEAVSQAILTRLNLFLGEWIDAGADVSLENDLLINF